MAKNFLDEAEDLGEAPKGSGRDIEPSTFEKIINVLDIPGSLARTAVKSAISPKEEVIPSVTKQLKRTVEAPTIAAAEAPTGAEINKQIFPEYKEESVLGIIGNITTEAALDPLMWFRPTKVPAKAVSVKLETAAEKQAAKAISKFSSKTATLKEGVDPEAIGSRLVQQDLQGLLKEPLKLYEKVSGKKHLQKIKPEDIETLQIKRGPREPGEIGKVSDNITTMLHDVSRNYGLKPVKLPELHLNELIKNSVKNLSLTSGESVDLQKVSDKLQQILKPTKEVKVPGIIAETPPFTPSSKTDLLLRGSTDEQLKTFGKKEALKNTKESSIQIPNTLSLPDLQQLRKNIGKQVADRSFYAAPDQAMRLETEVLRDLYRSLGDVIENSLKGKEIEVAGKTLDAAEFYKGQNNTLKQYLDLQSLLESQPLESLKAPDFAANAASVMAKAGGWGVGAGAASLAGLPINPINAMALGSIIGAGKATSDIVKNRTPEFLSPALKRASDIVETPYVPEAAIRTGITVGREPQSVSPLAKFGLTKSQVLKTRLPRNTEIIRRNPELFLAKLSQVPGTTIEDVRAAEEVFRNNPLKIKPMIEKSILMHPEMFEDAPFKILDGKILDPAERGQAADLTKNREDLNSIQKAKIISKLNIDGTYIG